jgi:hydroxypyruvate reductase
MAPALEPRVLLRSLFDRAVDAAGAEATIEGHLPPRPRGRTVVVGAGKAAAAMARAVERRWDGPLDGLVVTPYGHGVATERIAVIEAAHPVPDAAGQAAARRILAMVQSLGADDLVLALISGGGSALLALPAPGVPFEDKRTINRALLASGAAIHEINTVRKHLSAIKGGRLGAAAAPAAIHALIVSDIPGDDAAFVASGPTLPDPTTKAAARGILTKYRIVAPPAAARWLDEGEETPKPGDRRLARATASIITSAARSLDAAAACARDHGVTPVPLSDCLEGEAREVGRALAGIALYAARRGQPAAAPCVLLSGGETTVTVGTPDPGLGGRNRELALALALGLDGHPAISALVADTDGIDGTPDAAGAIVTPDTLARAHGLGRDPRADLARHDSGGLFAALGDAVVTGPTRTNVNDFRAILVAPVIART